MKTPVTIAERVLRWNPRNIFLSYVMVAVGIGFGLLTIGQLPGWRDALVFFIAGTVLYGLYNWADSKT